MKDYYEELWQRLPESLELPDLAPRLRFLLSEAHPGVRALDLGSGTGQFTAELARAGARTVGAEVAQAAVDRARTAYPGLDFRLVPIAGPLPFEDSAFDLVWASEVIEHVADTGPWLSEVRRVLAPGGRLLLTTPSHGRLRLALGGIERYSEPLGDHLHLYSPASLRGLLEEFDFAEVSVRSVGGPPLWRRMLMAAATRP